MNIYLFFRQLYYRGFLEYIAYLVILILGVILGRIL